MAQFLLKGDTKVEGVATDGLTCLAYAESRFTVDGNGKTIAPVQGSLAPDNNAPDGGPVTSGSAFGGQGAWQIEVPDSTSYYVACYRPLIPSHWAWEGPLMATPHTSLQGWTALHVGGLAGQTTIASGSNGVALPTGTIDVASSGAFGSGPWALVELASNNYQLVGYTGTSGGNSLTGCTGGAGTLATGMNVYRANVANAYRRLVMLTVNIEGGLTAGSEAFANPISTINGQILQLNTLGIVNSTGNGEEYTFSTTFPVDPGGAYAVATTVTGSGAIIGTSIIYADF